MIKKITTLVSNNRKVVARKALVLTGITLGIIAGTLLVKPDEDVIIGEVQEDGTFTISEKKPEA
jgi:hypothetical protein